MHPATAARLASDSKQTGGRFHNSNQPRFLKRMIHALSGSISNLASSEARSIEISTLKDSQRMTPGVAHIDAGP
jgi:hypothetical protein